MSHTPAPLIGTPENRSLGQILDKFGVRAGFECCQGWERIGVEDRFSLPLQSCLLTAAVDEQQPWAGSRVARAAAVRQFEAEAMERERERKRVQAEMLQAQIQEPEQANRYIEGIGNI